MITLKSQSPSPLSFASNSEPLSNGEGGFERNSMTALTSINHPLCALHAVFYIVRHLLRLLRKAALLL